MKTGFLIFNFLLSMCFYSTTGFSIDDFHCKIPTCRDFFFGLRAYPRREEYEKICFETVYALQAIPRDHGKCLNSQTKKLNEKCILALATTIKNCISQLYDLPDYEKRFYCGYTLMKYCAVHIGLEKYPLKLDP